MAVNIIALLDFSITLRKSPFQASRPPFARLERQPHYPLFFLPLSALQLLIRRFL